MDTVEYMRKVKNLFKSGTATDKQWDEMAYAVLSMSEEESCLTSNIDSVIDPVDTIVGGIE